MTRFQRLPQMQVLIVVTLCSVLIGCGPMFETRYNLTPPKSSSGRACVFQCENGKLQCQQMEQMRQEHCEQESRWEVERCQRQLERKGKKESWNDCWARSCTENTERCQEMYINCYRSCGGEVEVTQVCVSNCDKIGK
jgi:hypothetical protein